MHTARLEQVHQTKKPRSAESAPSTFPDDYVSRVAGGKPEDIDDVLERIDKALTEVTARALGNAASIEAV